MYLVLDISKDLGQQAQNFKGLLLSGQNKLIPNRFGYGKRVENSKAKDLNLKVINSFIGRSLRDFELVEIQGGNQLSFCSPQLYGFLRKNCNPNTFQFVNLTVNSNFWESSINFIPNNLVLVNCIDHTKSNLVYWDRDYSEVFEIDKLVLDYSKINLEKKIFLLGEMRKPIWIVREDFANDIQKEGFSGMKFLALDSFRL